MFVLLLIIIANNIINSGGKVVLSSLTDDIRADVGGAAMITEITHRVNFFDTDAMAVVHHANYIRWFEIGRVDFLRKAQITLTEMMDDNYVFPIVDVQVKYISSGHYDEVLVIRTIPVALTKAKMAFNYEIYRQSDNVLLVKGYTQNVFTHKDTGKITRLPEKYYSKLQQALK